MWNSNVLIPIYNLPYISDTMKQKCYEFALQVSYSVFIIKHNHVRFYPIVTVLQKSRPLRVQLVVIVIVYSCTIVFLQSDDMEDKNGFLRLHHIYI